jgi:hypothetical protein
MRGVVGCFVVPHAEVSPLLADIRTMGAETSLGPEDGSRFVVWFSGTLGE